MLDQLVSDAQGALAGDIDMVCIDYMIVFCVWILKLAALFELWKFFQCLCSVEAKNYIFVVGRILTKTSLVE